MAKCCPYNPVSQAPEILSAGDCRYTCTWLNQLIDYRLFHFELLMQSKHSVKVFVMFEMFLVL